MLRRSVLFLMALGGLTVPQVFAQKLNVTDYFPLTQGLKWTYNDTASGEVQTITVAEAGSAHGSTTRKMRVTGRTDFDEVSNDAQGIRLHARAGRGLAATFDPAVVFTAQEATVGQTFSSTPSVRNPATGNTMTWVTKISGVEDVTVPAGKFTGCLKIEMIVKDTALGTKFSHVIMHLAKNVGLVKRSGQFFGTYFVQELTGR